MGTALDSAHQQRSNRALGMPSQGFTRYRQKSDQIEQRASGLEEEGVLVIGRDLRETLPGRRVRRADLADIS